MKKSITFIVALLAFFGSFLMENTAQAQTCDSTVSYTNATLKYVGVQYDSSGKGDMYVFYTAIVGSSGKDVSHAGIQVPVCISGSNWSAGTWTGTITSPTLTDKKSSFSLGTDKSHPNSPYVIKTNFQINKSSTLNFYIKLDTMLKISCVATYIKPGSTFENDSIPGANSNCGPLPVKWYKVAVEAGDGINLIKWSTTTEIHNEKFEIERSDGNSIFQKIGEVAGAGNSSQILYYEFIDNHPLSGKNYYRVKQIDYDGKFDYSPIFSAQSKKESGLSIYPNPTKSGQVVTINSFGFMEANDNKIIIHDLVGKVILESVFTGYGNILYLNLSKGTYLITAISKDNNGRDKIFRQRLIVQ